MKKKYNQCHDVSEKNVDYLNVSIKRSKGELPDMEVAKAYANIITKTKLNNFSILDVGCLTGHFYNTFKKWNIFQSYSCLGRKNELNFKFVKNMIYMERIF